MAALSVRNAKPHLPAELPKTLKDNLASTMLCFAACPTTKATHTHTNKRSALLLLLLTSGAASRPLCKWQASCCSVISCPPQDHPKHTDTPSPSQISLERGVLPGFKLYYWRSTRNNRAFASMVGGLASGPLAEAPPDWDRMWYQVENSAALSSRCNAKAFFLLILGIFLVTALVHVLAFYGNSAGRTEEERVIKEITCPPVVGCQ